jgi:hypothetical protein
LVKASRKPTFDLSEVETSLHRFSTNMRPLRGHFLIDLDVFNLLLE